MAIFGNRLKISAKSPGEAVPAAVVDAELRQLGEDHGTRRPVRHRTGRTQVYAVRVRENFRGEMLTLQAEIQLERQKSKSKARKVTEGEVIELMLEVFKTARRNGDATGDAVPLANDIWQGVHEIARRLQISPAEVVEQLVVQKVGELGLLPRK